MKQDLALIVPTYNKKNRIKYLLKSLENQSLGKDFKIVIVDDGSTDNTEQLISKYKDILDLEYVKIENQGRSHARNVGIEHAKTKYLIFCDDDMILPKNYIEQHLKLLQENPNCLIHGKIYNLPYASFFEDPENGTIMYVNNKNVELSYIMKYMLDMECAVNQESLIPQRRMSMQEKYIREIYCRGIDELSFLLCSGGNFSCMREDILSVGKFNENIDFEWGAEDLELGYRFMSVNKRMIYSDEAYNYHICHYRKNYAEPLIRSCKKFYDIHKNPIILKLPDLFLKKITLEEFLKFVELC